MENDPYINSLKADIVPTINAELQIEPNRLFSLSIEALNKLFGALQLKNIPIDKIRDIVLQNSDSNAIIQALKMESQQQSPVDVPITPPSASSPTHGAIYGQDSIKADIVPVIKTMIDVSSEKLFALSVHTLNEIFGYLESGVIPATEIESIVLSTNDINEVSSKLQAKISTDAPTTTDTLKEDLIIGILFNIPEIVRGQIEHKLREIDNTDELMELSQLDLPELQSKLGIEMPAPQRYDERMDLIAGILSQLPPSLQGVISDRLQEITDLDRLQRIANMNYVQVQNELGLAAQSPMAIPAEFVNPVDTASRTPSESTASSSTSPETQEGDAAPEKAPEPSPQVKEMLRKRREENEKHVPIIGNIVEKAWKVKISEGQAQSPEAAALKEKIEILYRMHSERVAKIGEQLKKVKDRKRFKALFDWYIFSHRIEEIETYVEHWQGQVQGIGGFRAAINVSRFDPIVEHMPTKEIEGLIIQAKKALERVHSSNINVRARGVEDIKQISNYLLQKMRY
jgi:hypothetical protein